MKSLIVILMTLLFLSFAEAKAPALVHTKNAYAKSAKAMNPVPQTQLNTVMNHAQFVKLAKEKQELYISELQLLMRDLQKQDEALNTQYQTAGHWLSLFVNDAVAGSTNEDRPCVYAGWISSMDINGRACLRPKSDGCARGQIQCNPMLYGMKQCVQPNRGATSACEGKHVSLSRIANEIKGHEQEWSNMREELSNYCSDPRPTQGKVCAIIRGRLARIERVIGEVPAPRFETQDGNARVSSAGSATAEANAPAGDAEAVVVAPSRSGASAPVNAQPPPKAVSISVTRSSGNCNAATLLANLKPGSSNLLAASNFMDLESARTLMCSTDPIPSDWVSSQRALINRAATNIRGSDKYARADRINYTGIMQNFNACVRDAETLRRTGAGAVTGSFATIIETGEFVKMYDEANRPIVGLGSQYDLEGLLRAKGISICNLRTRDGVQIAPAYTNSNSGSSAPSSSAE